MGFDDALSSVGEFHRYQKWLLILVCTPACFLSGFTMFSDVFISDVPGHHCTSLIEEDKASLLKKSLPATEDYEHALKTLSIPLNDKGKFSQCEQYDIDVIDRYLSRNETSTTPDEFVAKGNWSSVHCRNGWEFNTEEYNETLVTKFEVVCEKEWMVSLAQSIFFASGVIGTLAVGWMSDRWGRRPAILFSTAVMIIGNLAALDPPNYVAYIVIRCIIGLSYPSVYNTSFVLVTETIGPAKRSVVAVVCDLTYAFGMIVLACLAYFFYYWRALQAAISIPMIFLVGFYWLVPESPRWLASRGRIDEAEVIVQKMAAVNGFSISPNFLADLMSKEQTDAGEGNSAKKGISQLTNYPRVALKMFAITVVWTLSAMIFHGMSFVASILPTKIYIGFLASATGGLLGCCLAWSVTQRYGRKCVLLGTLILSGGLSFATAVVPDDMPWLAALLPSLAKLFASILYIAVYIFAGELLPTVIRGFAISVASTGTQFGMVITPYIIQTGNIYGREIPLVIYGVLAIIAAIFVVTLPETSNVPLPTTMEECENYKEFIIKSSKSGNTQREG